MALPPLVRNVWDTVSTPGVAFSAGILSAIRTDVTFSNSNNVTFGLDTNGVITASASGGGPSGGAAIQGSGAFSQNTGTIQFNNSNGVTFGLTAGQMTASVETNYQTPGAYLTTAALSGDTSKYAGTSTGIAGGSVTLNTAGISISLPAYLTTAQPPGAYLTTAQPVGDYAGTNTSVVTTAGTDLSLAVNTSGVTVAYPKWLTTYAPGGSGAGTGFSSTSTAGAVIAGTLDTNGLSLGVPNYLTTAQSPGAYLTTAALSGDTSKYAGTSTGIAGGSVTLNTAGISISLPAYLTTYAYPRLDQVLDPTADKLFSMGSNQVQFSWATGGSFSTNATRHGMFELDMAGNLTQEADVIHAHQHGGAPTQLDILHIEGDGANVTGARLQMSASVAAEINQPIKFTTADAGFSIGSVPFIMGTEMSNSVANLNANFVQGKASSVLAGTGFTSASTAGASIVGTLQTNGLSVGIPAYLTTAQPAGNYAGTGTSVVTTSGTDLSMALNTAGLTVAYPKWITTAAGGGGAGSATSVATTSGTDLTLGANSSGITIGYPKWITTYVNDLTSGRAGVNTSVATTAGTDITLGVNTSGVTIGYPAWITTYASQTVQSAIKAVGVSNTGNTAGNVGYITGSNYALAGSGSITLSQSTAAGAATCYIQHPAWITTYVNDLTSGRAGVNTAVSTTGGTDITLGVNTSGVTIGYPKWITTYVNDLTSQRAGTNTSVATTSGTDLTLGVNTSGVTIGYPKWITTYVNDLTSGRAGTNTSVVTTSGTDLTFAANTSGITIAYPKWITTAAGGGVAISNSQTLFSTGTVAISAQGAMTIASSAGGQSMMFSVPATSLISAGAGISISTTGSTIIILTA